MCSDFLMPERNGIKRDILEKENLNRLFRDFIANRCSAKDIERLMHYFDFPSSASHLRQLIQEQLNMEDAEITDPRINDIVSTVDAKLASMLANHKHPEKQRADKLIFWRFAAAAAVLLLIGFSIFWSLQITDRSVETNETPIAKSKEVVPGKNQARLTLYNGEKLEFDKSVGTDKSKYNASLDYSKGRLVYRGQSAEETTRWNLLEVPKAGTFEIELPDGSIVWINANSKLHFPNRFADDERTVKIEGEAFFQVKKDKNRPFKVQAGELNISVLGTSFNVRAYQPAHISTTLVEGLVRLNYHDQQLIMTPGKRAFIDARQVLQLQTVDLESATAWKEGYFYFKDESLYKILQDIANWYDLKVSVEGNLRSGQYSGSMDRNGKLTGLLEILSSVGDLDFELNGNQLKVKQKKK